MVTIHTDGMGGIHVFEEPMLRRYYGVLGWGLFCPILLL